ncbi:MAG: glycoside hydrolase family 127 protein [Clostridia bacterium]|nr:glycoside hydrolase family 127 protein [Clostridia bacterium]
MQKWNLYTAKELRADGWLRRQLEIQAAGLSGNLDRVWRDIRDSAWIGGDAEGWERVPYWLDGFVPLAYLLDDADMIARAKKYIDAILAAQRPDGWICPCDDEARPTYDTWAVQLITKVLVVYYECSSDERVPDVIYRTLKNYYELLRDGTISLFKWGKYRWFECFIAIEFCYRRCREGWLIELARILREQGQDYNSITHLWERPLNAWKLDTHIVNLAMCLKYEAISHELLGEDYTDRAEALHQILDKFNGTPVGLFTGDECLSGLSPIQGTELCAVVEQMYSYELLFAHTGEPRWADRLEMLAFNALPAAISDDMWAHQYVQMSNQIACIKFPGKSVFRTNGAQAHLFGLEPNYGCCTANFNQGWPKLALSTFMHDGDTVINVLPIPSELSDGGKRIRLETDYPFRNIFKYTIETDKPFRFKIRIPACARDVAINGQICTEKEPCFDIEAGKTVISMAFHTFPELISRPRGLKTAKCGSLIFSVPIKYSKKMYEYEAKGVERKFPYCDYEYIPESEWSYGYASNIMTVERRELADIPFSSESPAIVVHAKVRRIDWGLEDGYETVCAKTPASRKPIDEEERDIELYPYGCAKLRMTELPKI